jgi:class 3 adenylate cyclase/tetratricopeptide (TPR) repeat protein
MAHELPEGTVTVLFTDVEASTDLVTRRGDEAAQAILRPQRELVHRQVEQHSGHEVKSLGDGFMVAFASARRAVACAVGIQRALEQHNRQHPDQQVRVRIGLNTGEAIQEEADLFGEAVNAAARITAKAKGGQILLSETVRGVLGRAKQVELVDRGRFRLKGFPERWRLYEVAWQEAGAPMAVVPALVERTPFVGREAERANVRRLLDQAVRGQGTLVMIGGEPGVGKTRLAEELLLEARQRGVLAWTGHCYDMEGTLSYAPFVEILETAARVVPAAALRDALSDSAPEVAKLLPGLRRLFPDIPAPLELPPEQERRYLFNCVLEFLQRAAQRQPLVLTLEDLHWGDDSTLLLLQHITQRLHEMSVLILGTYRDVELDVAHPLAVALGELTRQRLAHRLALKRLPEAGVEAMLRALSGQEPPTPLVQEVYRETEGNPFFVEEVFQYLAEEGKLFDEQGRWRANLRIGELEVPRSVRLLIGQRLDRLNEECHRALTAAAVVGRSFSFELLEALGDPSASSGQGVEADALLDAIDEAERAHLITSAPDGPEACFTFVHELIRQTLVSGLSPPRRQRLHLRVAEAMERLYLPAGRHGAHALEEHQAGAAADRQKTAHYLALAGERAMTATAYEEAAAHYERAIEALAMTGRPEEAERCQLSLALGEAYRRAGELLSAREAFLRAADMARSLDAAESLAQAALGVGGRVLIPVEEDLAQVALLEDALYALGQGDSELRARVLARLSLALHPSGQWEREASLSREAVEIARRVGSPYSLLEALHARLFALWGPERGPETVYARLPLATEATEIVEEAGMAAATEMALVGHGWRGMNYLELGDVSAADAGIKEFARIAEELRQPLYLWWRACVLAMRAIMDGRFEEGERLAQEALTVGQAVHTRADLNSPLVAFGAQLFELRWHQGRLAELETALKGYLEQYPDIPVWRAVSALLHSEADRPEKVRDEFEQLAIADFADLPRDVVWLICVALLSEVCAYLGDAARSAKLYDLLLPYAGRTVVAGNPVILCRGSVSRNLGLLAATMRRWDEAQQHFQDALEMNTRMRAPPWVAHTQRDYARMLIDRNAPGDREKARQLLTEAIAMYRQIGVAKHVEMAETLLRGL